MPTNSVVHCIYCGSNIKEDYLKKRYYQEEHPEIKIGPYCASCFQKVRVCCGCEHPFLSGTGQIKYYNKGLWYCTSCASDLKTCDHCGSISSNLKLIDGKNICENCVASNYFYCDYCKDYHAKEKNVFKFGFESNSSEYLKSVWEDIYRDFPNGVCYSGFTELRERYTPKEVYECQHCRRLKTKSSMKNYKYCRDCYNSFNTCFKCKEKHPHARRRYVDNREERVCYKCANSMPTCSKCNSLCTEHTKIHGKVKDRIICVSCNGDGYTEECPVCLNLSGDKGVCHTCNAIYFENKCDKCGAIRDFDGKCRKCGESKYKIYCYSKKPQLVFNGKNYKDLFFGIENEQVYNDDSDKNKNLSNIYKKFDPTVLFCKSDSSIRGYGFELVTQPMTLDFLNAIGISSWFTGTIPSSSCGMHVHLSRDSFRSELHIFKFINFIHNNEKLCNLVSGRDYNSYNCKLEKKPSTATKPGSTSRYCRINTSGASTIEVRMYSGCTSEFEMKYRIEFTHAIWKMYENASISNENLMGFIKDNRKVYPNIYKFLVAKGEIK